MGGRGSGGKSKRQPTDAEIANEVDRDTARQPPTEQEPTEPPRQEPATTDPGAALTDEQRAAILRIGNTRAIHDPRRMERELSDLGLFDKGTGWFTEQGMTLFGQITTGDWTTDISAADTLLPPYREQP